MFGMSHCYYSSSCFSDTREPTPASVSAERQIPCVLKCAVRALHSAFGCSMCCRDFEGYSQPLRA